MTNSFGQAYTVGRIAWKEEASNFPSLKQMFPQAGIESDKAEAFLIFLKSENCSDPNASEYYFCSNNFQVEDESVIHFLLT